ncbi:carbohydrate kinase family protein [Clostridium sp. AM58-1XD]|uniref:carbohydrate kinase family protein n=1 Tax=Clostridium sp. AM58-1XD TaxID=2292307 RepID=UPI000E4AD059|nr:carbohydrate kinase family protein [Clostridium sp. AM58-1XD]RGY98210.1 carbohydrate kinase family protein [Clostridium sp. AM58-1XD]
MGEEKAVLCVGLLIQDIFLKPVDRELFDQDSVIIADPVIQFGGDALNQAVILNRLGVKVSLAGAVGCDEAGSNIIRFLKEESVEHSMVEILDGSVTTGSYVLCESSGERHFLVCGNAKHRYLFEEFSRLDAYQLVSIGSLCCMDRMDRGGSLKLLQEAKKRGIMTAADFSGLYTGNEIEIRKLLECIDYLWPSYEEAASVSGETEPEKIISRLTDLGASNIILKMGKKGCLVRNALTGEITSIPAVEVHAVDTTGAGDNFVAGCIYGLMNGRSLEEAAAVGAAAGAIAVTEIGANKAVRNREQIESFGKR